MNSTLFPKENENKIPTDWGQPDIALDEPIKENSE
jgi:hypothetical protein